MYTRVYVYSFKYVQYVYMSDVQSEGEKLVAFKAETRAKMQRALDRIKELTAELATRGQDADQLVRKPNLLFSGTIFHTLSHTLTYIYKYTLQTTQIIIHEIVCTCMLSYSIPGYLLIHLQAAFLRDAEVRLALQAKEKEQMLEDVKNEYEVRLSFHIGESKQLSSTISSLQVGILMYA